MKNNRKAFTLFELLIVISIIIIIAAMLLPALAKAKELHRKRELQKRGIYLPTNTPDQTNTPRVTLETPNGWLIESVTLRNERGERITIQK